MTRALLRDAAWYAKPETTRPKRYHVKVGDRIARCDAFLPLVEESAIPAEEVPESLRCQRRRCREAWPAQAPVEEAPAAEPLSALLARVEATLRAARGGR